MENKEPRFPNKYLVMGVSFLISGGLLLMWTNGLLPGFKNLWPVPLVIMGICFLYLAFLRAKNEILIIPGIILTFCGILLLLLNTILSASSILKIWPAFMLISGISLIPYGYKKQTRFRIAIFVPAGVIIGLSIIFLPFSLGLSPIRFKDFISMWWPVILVLTGIFFIFSFFYKKGKRKK